MFTSWIFVFYGIVIILFGLYVGGIGFLGLVRKRPIAFPARQLMWIMLLVFIPNLINSFQVLFQPWGRSDTFLTFMPLFNLILFALLIYVFWRQMTGYMVFGIYDETFRDALTSALNKLNLPFQETISKIRLTGLDADLQAAVAAWMGTAQIRIKQYQHARVTKQIAHAMNEYFATTPIKVNNIAYIVYLILGILMLAFATFFIPSMYNLLR